MRPDNKDRPGTCISNRVGGGDECERGDDYFIPGAKTGDQAGQMECSRRIRYRNGMFCAHRGGKRLFESLSNRAHRKPL